LLCAKRFQRPVQSALRNLFKVAALVKAPIEGLKAGEQANERVSLGPASSCLHSHANGECSKKKQQSRLHGEEAMQKP